jgi:hypothetical protein
MENQQKITGYRELSQGEVDAINKVKDLAADTASFLDALDENVKLDARWLAIAKTDLQKGFMSLTRAIAKPEGF